MVAAHLHRTIRRFAADARGALAPAFAILSVSMLAMAGMGFNYGMTVRTKLRIQSAADTAVLAAARMNDADSARPAIAKRYFESQLDTATAAMVKVSSFAVTPDGNSVTASINVEVPMKMASVVGMSSIASIVSSKAAIAKPDVRQLDLVLCIDGTGSMTATLNAVKTNALNLEVNLNDELTRRGIAKFDAMRVRVIFYRDYGGTYLTGSNVTMSVWNGTSYVTKTIKSNDPAYWTYVGDTPPTRMSGFYALPSSRTDFQAFVNPEVAWGGGDTPESGLECVNEAMDSTWAKVGDMPAGGSKPLQAVYPTIVVWTDAAAHKPSYSVSLKNTSYPAATKMPRTYTDLKAKWDKATTIDQNRKLLIFFGNPDLATNDRDGLANGWQTLKTWPGFMVGGTLTEGNSNMVNKLADAIASRVRSPTLTQ